MCFKFEHIINMQLLVKCDIELKIEILCIKKIQVAGI